MHMNGIMKGALVTVGGVVRRSMVVVATRAGTSLFPVGADLAATAPTFRSSYLSSWNVRVRRRNDTRTTSLGSIVQGKLLLNEIETTNLGLWGGLRGEPPVGVSTQVPQALRPSGLYRRPWPAIINGRPQRAVCLFAGSGGGHI